MRNIDILTYRESDQLDFGFEPAAILIKQSGDWEITEWWMNC